MPRISSLPVEQLMNNNTKTAVKCMCIFIHTILYLHANDVCILCSSGDIGTADIPLIKWICPDMKSVIIRLIDWWWVYTCMLFSMCVCVGCI